MEQWDWSSDHTDDIQHDLAMSLADGEDGDFEASMRAELVRRRAALPVGCKWVHDLYARGKRRLVYHLEEER